MKPIEELEVGVIIASSTSGAACTSRLLEQPKGPKVRAIFRTEEKAAPLRAAHAGSDRLRIIPGVDADQPYKLGQCLGGCDVVFIITPAEPPEFEKDALRTMRMIRAASEVGAKHIILAGSWTALRDDSRKTSERLSALSKRFVQPETFLQEMQQQYGCTWTILRGGFFHANYAMFAQQIKEKDQFEFPDISVPCVDPVDIGHVAAAIAMKGGKGHDGKIYDISGPAYHSLSDVAQTMSSVLNRNIKFINVPKERVVESLPLFLQQLVDYMVEFGKAAVPISSHVMDVTGAPPIPISQWVQKNRAMFEP